jgi:flagellar hook-associated protein 3 FlgL
MRIATFNAYENVITNLQSRQRGLQNSQEQLTSGKRVAKPSDDPGGRRARRACAGRG